MKFIIDTADSLQIKDKELTDLLEQVFVGGGFTEPELAATLFEATAVRNRGILMGAREKQGLMLAGMVIIVPPGSPARRLAQGNEAEMHLLGVKTDYRMHGLGKLLVAAAIDTSKQSGYEKIILWTQPGMKPAQKLYEASGFIRSIEKDFRKNDRDFRVYEKDISA